MSREIDFLKLYQCVFNTLNTESIQKLLDEVFKITGVPIMAVDIIYNVLGISPQERTGDYKWDYLLEHRNFDADMALREYKDGTMQSVNYNEAPYIINWGEWNKEYPKVLGLIRVNDVVEGYVVMQCSCGQETKELLKAMKIIQEACSFLYKNTDSESSMEETYQKVFIKELFNSQIQTQQQLDSWARDTQFLPKPPYRILAIGTAAPKEINILTFIRKSIQQLYPFQLLLIQHNILYSLLYNLEAVSIYYRFKKTMDTLLSQVNAYCGVSNEFTDLLELQNYRIQAEDAMRLGTHKGRTDRICLYREMYLSAILAPRIENMPSCNYLSPVISAVEEYDHKHGTDLSDTLETYIHNLCRTTETAKQLHIHRNSLMYRINKIEEITGEKLQEAETFMHLQLSFYMRNHKW